VQPQREELQAHASDATEATAFALCRPGERSKLARFRASVVTSKSCSVTGPRSSVREVMFPSAPSPTVMRSRTRSQGRK
jgi:hypothetical protein